MIALRRAVRLCVVLLPGAFAACAQDNAAQPLMPMARGADPAFEVAVIRPADPNGHNQGFSLKGRRISIGNNTMTSLICFAYSIRKTRIVNAPQRFGEKPWDIDGLPDTAGRPNWIQYRRMLQKLLSALFGRLQVLLRALCCWLSMCTAWRILITKKKTFRIVPAREANKRERRICLRQPGE